MTPTETLLLDLATALAIGLLVGLERGWRERDDPEGSRTAGLRSFGIFGLMGGVFAALSVASGAASVLAAGFLGFALLFGAFQWREAVHDGTFSVTSLLAGLTTFGLGALAVLGDRGVAVAAATALTALLASREVLHAGLRRLSWAELRSALVLAVMSAIVLPLLPDRTIDPWGGLNPRQIWLFTVLIATISYAGYIAVRVLGARRGVLVSGLAGALVSSTAVTVALARMAREGAARPLAGAAMLAALVSILRVSGVVALLTPALLPHIAGPVGAGGLVLALAGGALIARGAPAAPAPEPLRNPFDLRALLAFAAGFAALSVANAALVGRFGATSLLASSALSALFDVDVAVLSALRLDPATLGPDLIARAVLVALAANTVGKVALAAAAGPARFWAPLGLASLAALAAGGAAWALL
ncbi:hypothetical protein LPB142_10175 [Rhodobacter xanthinilyticus]|uniref:Uncharacterized protein n=1 Tax=Rhodobacter xanthinilyticus TaxID=1850250 RepID=A0A1D9MGL0_9RHOB|nr:DUF4010 domain-containing protein [Rhodobacter xanthinilyticus]AOZ71004.1 hypothetical protein LPB142_10175 [Rhodobacter xanthinilyticus]